MGILKNGSYTRTSVSAIDFSNINLATEEHTESLKFDKEEYLALMEDAKKEGYEAGFKSGSEDGYNSGLKEFEEQKTSLYSLLELDKENVIEFLNNESLNYINNFQKDIGELIVSSINKVFLNSISNEDIMKVYLTNLIKTLKLRESNFTITANNKTIELCADVIESNDIKYHINNVFDDYDLSVKTDRETIEYFLKDEFKKIQDLFK